MSYNSSFHCVRLSLSACSSASAVFVLKLACVSHCLLISQCAGCVLVLISCVRVLIEIYDNNMNTSFHRK